MDNEFAGPCGRRHRRIEGHRLCLRGGVRSRRRQGRARFAQPRQPRRGARPLAAHARIRPSRSSRTCAIADDAARMADDAQANLGPIDVLVNSAGAAKRYAPDGLVRAGVARCDGREVLQLHPADRHHRQVDGRARPRRDRQYHRHGRQGRESDPSARRRGERRADARDGRTRGRLRSRRRARECHQSGRHAHRPRAGGPGRRSEDDRHAGSRSAGARSRRRFRCGGSARRRKSPTSRCSSRRMRRATSPARSSRWTAARAR